MLTLRCAQAWSIRQFVTAHLNRFVWDAHPTKSASCRCESMKNPPIHTRILPSPIASLASQRTLRRCPRDANIFVDSTSYPQTVHNCRGLLPTNRITPSQTCFFRVSFWVSWSPSVSIHPWEICLCHKSEMSDGQFWIIHFHGQSIHMCEDRVSGEQRCCLNSIPHKCWLIVCKA